MKNQALLSLKDKSKKLKCRLLQFLFRALRYKIQKWTSIADPDNATHRRRSSRLGLRCLKVQLC